MMIFSLVAMIGLEKCCIKSACLQWLCHSGERTVARGPLVFFFFFFFFFLVVVVKVVVDAVVDVLKKKALTQESCK